MIILIDFRFKLHNIRYLNPPQQPHWRLTAHPRLSRSFLFKITHKRSRVLGFSELTGFMWNLFAHIHPVRPLAGVGFGPRLDSGAVIQPVGCEKVRGKCCLRDGANERMCSGTRRSVPPSPRWSGAALWGFPRRSHAEQNKQCQRAFNPHKTHTQLLNEYIIMNTHWLWGTFTQLIFTLQYCSFPCHSNTLLTPQYCFLCVKSVYLRYWLSFMNSYLCQNSPLLLRDTVLVHKTVHRSPLNVTTSFCEHLGNRFANYVLLF